jgi:intracellular sulfur oxidation DsrE/DsrF family protein
MKKIFLCLAWLFLLSTGIVAQKQQKIVFDFTQGDTASFAKIIRYTKTIMDLTGNAKLEVVCHGPGLDMLVKGKTTVGSEIEVMQKLGVVFVACEATMKRRGIDKSQLVPQAVTVPAAILELSSKQQDGWSYIKE